MTNNDCENFHSILDEAVRSLTKIEHFRTCSIVSMPLLYPSGDSVIIEISCQNGRYNVSDRGTAYREAELFDGARYFVREAIRISNDAGIDFNGKEISISNISVENLPSALIVISNASAEATAFSNLRVAERTYNDDKEALFIRLSSIYKAWDVQKDIEIMGATHKWRISVAVYGGTAPALFEPVSGAYISAVGTAAKFQDLAANLNPPARFSVIKSREDLGDFYGLIARASTKMLPMTASDHTFNSLLEAA